MLYISPIGALALIIFAIVVFLLPLIALVSILKNDFSSNDKLIWVLIVLLFPLFGPLLYFSLGRNKKVA